MTSFHRMLMVLSLLCPQAHAWADVPGVTQSPAAPAQTSRTTHAARPVTVDTTSQGDRAGQIAAALARWRAREPSLAQVRRAALQQAGLDGRQERSWRRRGRRAGWLPTLTARVAHGRGDDRDLSRTSTGAESLDLGWDRDVDVELRAVWQLDRVVFDDVEIRILQATQRSYRERVQLLARVTSLYYQRRKLQLSALLAPASDPGKAALHALAVAESTGQLDALTGGYFSRASHCMGASPCRDDPTLDGGISQRQAQPVQ